MIHNTARGYVFGLMTAALILCLKVLAAGEDSHDQFAKRMTRKHTVIVGIDPNMAHTREYVSGGRNNGEDWTSLLVKTPEELDQVLRTVRWGCPK